MRKIVISYLFFQILAFGKNPTVSSWMKNLSESNPSEEKQWVDHDPELIVSGNTVHLMWMTQERNPDIKAIYYKRSRDGGRTWDEKQRVFAHKDLLETSGLKHMAVDGQNVLIAYGYYGQGNTWYGILGAAVSRDGGTSFQTKVLRSLAEVYHPYDVRVTADRGKITVGFRNQCNWCVNNAYELLTSTDGGQSFTTTQVYSTDKGSSWGVNDLLRVGNYVYTLYDESYYYYGINRGVIYFAAQSDGSAAKAATMSVPSKNGEHKSRALQDYNYTPKIAASGQNVYTVWEGYDSGDVWSVYVRRSTDSGQTWQDPVNLTRATMDAKAQFQGGQVTIDARGPNVYVLVLTTDAKVWLYRSANSGQTFDRPKLLVSDTGYWQTGGWWPMVVTDPRDNTGSKVYVGWKNPQYVYSSDSGAAFSAPAFASPHFSWAGDTGYRPRFAIGDDGALHWVMEGATAYGGDADIFYRRIEPKPAEPAAQNSSLSLKTEDRISSGGFTYGRWDAMSVRSSADLNFKTAMTVSLWVKPAGSGITTGTTSVVKPIIHKRETYDPYSAYSLGTIDYYGKRVPFFQVNTSKGLYWVQPPGGTGYVADDKWVHLAGTYDASLTKDNLKLYINGQLVNSVTGTGDITTASGSLFAGYYGSWEIDELSFWSRALTSADLTTIRSKSLAGNEVGLTAYYNFNATTRDVTGRGNDGTLLYNEAFVPAGWEPSAKMSAAGSVNSASYSGETVAPESLASLYGAGFTDRSEAASTLPLPTTLAGVTVKVRDNRNTEKTAELFYAGPGQINFIVPPGLANGYGEVTVTGPNGSQSSMVNIDTAQPGIFSALMSGKGVAAAYAILYGANGTQDLQMFFDSSYAPLPVRFGGDKDQLYLFLYGTGIRGSAASTQVTVAGVSVPAKAFKSGEYYWLDQINIGPLPVSLAGKGLADIQVTVSGKKANQVTVLLQ